MDFDIKAVETAIENANKAIGSKAENAEALAKKAFDQAEKLIGELTETKSKFDSNKSELDALRKQLNDLSAEMSKPKFTKGAEMKSWEEEIAEQYAKQAPEMLKNAENRTPQNTPIVFALKSSPYSQTKAVTIGLDTTVEAVGSASQYTITENTGIISAIRQRVLTYLNNVAVGSIAKEYALWMEELDESGTPIFIAEGDAKTGVPNLHHPPHLQ